MSDAPEKAQGHGIPLRRTVTSLAPLILALLILAPTHGSLLQSQAAGVVLVTLGGSLPTPGEPGPDRLEITEQEAQQINENRIRQSTF